MSHYCNGNAFMDNEATFKFDFLSVASIITDRGIQSPSVQWVIGE